jgi:hypothetical protein
MHNERLMDGEGFSVIIISNVDFDALTVWGSTCMSRYTCMGRSNETHERSGATRLFGDRPSGHS